MCVHHIRNSFDNFKPWVGIGEILQKEDLPIKETGNISVAVEPTHKLPMVFPLTDETACESDSAEIKTTNGVVVEHIEPQGINSNDSSLLGRSDFKLHIMSTANTSCYDQLASLRVPPMLLFCGLDMDRLLKNSKNFRGKMVRHRCPLFRTFKKSQFSNLCNATLHEKQWQMHSGD